MLDVNNFFNDDNEDEDEVSADNKRRRGSPKGVKKGRRKQFFIAAAIHDNNLIQKEIVFDKSVENPTEELAKEYFKTKFGVDAQSVLGPYYEVKNGLSRSSDDTVNNEFLDISHDKIFYTNKRIKGEYHGWNIIGHVIMNYPNYVHLIFVNEINPGEKKKQSPRIDRPINCNLITNISEL